jgi:hypothetical protein
MRTNAVPSVFLQLISAEIISATDLVNTQDGFWLLCKSLSDILAKSGIFDFPCEDGSRFACDKFFDDWFLFAVPGGDDYVYSLLKMREQEHDAENGSFADGDTPGVTVSFVPFSCEALLDCLAVPTDENRRKLDYEIECVVVRRGQRYHDSLKMYFIDPRSEGAYLVADQYVKYIASFAKAGVLDVPKHYAEISQYKNKRLREFIESVNLSAGCVVCDHKKIYLHDTKNLTDYERAAVLATHTGNTSIYSFAAEVEYHARFLNPFAKIKIPFLKKSVYDSALRADMTIDDADRRRTASYYKENSQIVKKHYRLHEKLMTEENK